MTMTRSQLQRLFDELNQRYFGGRLPKYRVVHSNQFRTPGAFTMGQCLPSRLLIRLRHGMDLAQERRVLLHEMCHIGEPHHGRRFQARLLRLAAQGEAWAAEEAEQYSKMAFTWRNGLDSIKDALDEWAHKEPRPDFRSVKRSAAYIMCFDRVSQVDHSLPWLKAAWRKACQEADQERETRLRLGIDRLSGSQRQSSF